ncbi:MAG: adenosine deaminase [Thermoleophilia bacterium]
MTIDENIIRSAPKVLLHDHLDGGLRPQTIVDLARETGYDGLPTTDPQELRQVISRGANRNDLVLYLETFAHTVAVMQTREGLERVAAECAEDLAADGLVYAEIRFAPELHLDRGLDLQQVVDAVLAGFERGSAGTGLTVRVLCSAMRQQASSLQIAELAIANRDQGVCGFDIAGPEAGYPPSRHLDAFSRCMREHFHITVHAGEAFGLPSIAEAIHTCGAERLGHGVRLIDDIMVNEDGTHTLGTLAAFVRDTRVALEMCPSSNVHVGAVPSLDQHPVGLMKNLRFRVTVNTDNRLMSDTTLSHEFALLSSTFGWTLNDVRWATVNAMKSAFLPFDERLALINRVIKPGFAMLGADG